MSIHIDYVLPRVLRYHLRIFQTFGFHTLTLRTSQANVVEADGERCSLPTDRLLQCWTVLLATAFGILFTCILLIDDEFIYKGDAFGSFNDMLKFSLGQIAIMVVYFEALFKRSELAHFWQIYAKLRPTSAIDKCNWRAEVRQNARFLIVFYSMCLLDLSILFVFCWLQNFSHHMLLFWVTFQPYISFIHMHNMYLVLHMELMRQELAQLAHELSLLADYTRFAFAARFPGFEDYIRRRLHEKQFNYQRIHQMYVHFQNAFGCSMLAVLLKIHVRVVVDIYFMYYSFYQEWNNIDYIMTISAIMEIPAFIFTSKSCMAVVNNITYQLHNIVTNDSSVLLVQIQNFSLQIQHERLRIDGLGVTSFDGYMLSHAVCTLTTYMIFFIQFIPKFGKL